MAKDKLDASRAEAEAAAGLVKSARSAIAQGELDRLAEKLQQQVDLELAKEHGRQSAIALDEVLSGEMPTVSRRLITKYQKIELAFDTLPTPAFGPVTSSIAL